MLCADAHSSNEIINYFPKLPKTIFQSFAFADTAELVENLNGTSTESFLNDTTSFSEPSPTAGEH